MMNRSSQSAQFAAWLEEQRRLKQAKLASTDAAPGVPPQRRGERAAAGPSPDTCQQADRLLESIEEVAAVSGRFDPRTLLPHDEQLRRATLSRLASVSTVEAAGDTKTWLLEPARRVETLKRLAGEGRLATTLQSTLPPTDRFGEMLRAVLREGTNVPLDALPREDLLAVAAAVEATADVDIPKPDTDRLRELISKKQFLADYDVLIEHGFVGREAELQRLEAFAAGAVSAGRQWSGLVLTGLGGAGKSTLLAKFATDAVRKQMATVVILDFDRPGIDPSDTPWLELEIAKSVGQQYAQIAERLERLSDASNRYRASLNVQQSVIAERKDVERTLRSVVSEIHVALKDVNAEARPFLLVLDTFEEVAQRHLVPRILDWLDEIAESLWPTPLRVIFSGRLFDNSRAALEGPGVVDDVELRELEPYHAQQLLEKFNVPEATAERLATSDVLPRRPLELKLLARLVLDEPGTSIDALEDQVRKGGEFARELFAGLVYRRVLLRIKDDTARTLAYPGLVLRFVTPELVEKVLAPALDLPPMDERDAASALDTLAGYDWLTYRAPGGEVWHRKDLRRSMLKAMIAENREKAERISRSAVEYFEAFTEDRLWSEGVYHRLMLVRSRKDSGGFRLDEVKIANEYIAGDIADLPPESVALVKFASGHELSPPDVPLLPDSYIQSAYGATGARCVSSREFGLAAHLVKAVREDGLLPHHSPIEPWEVEALFATASWSALERVDRAQRIGDRSREFHELATVVFPDAVTSPAGVDLQVLERAIAETTGPRRHVDPSRLQTQLSRLSVGLVLMDRDGALSNDARRRLTEHLGRIRGELRSVGNSLFDRKMLLLEMVSRSTAEAHSTLRVSPWTMTLSRPWLERFATRMPDLVDDAGRDVARDLAVKVDDVLKHGKRGRLTVRTVLGSVNAFESAPVDVPFVVFVPFERLQSVDDWMLLRGPDPEFRDPCRFALLDAFNDGAGRRQLGKIFCDVVPFSTIDLEPDGFAEAIGTDPEHALETYVEVADRAGVLHGLLTRARKERPTEKLVQVGDAYARWIDAVRAVFLSSKAS